MPEMKNNFQKGRMNKDLDERLVSNGEYRDALNVEIATSNDSDMGTLQTLKGNTFLGVNGVEGVCIGSIADDKNDKLYFMVAGNDRDRIIEYDYTAAAAGLPAFAPVCIDHYSSTGRRALNFNEDFLITGINIIDNLLFWTDNNSEPKKINIDLGKQGSVDFAGTGLPSFTLHTKLMVRDVSPNAQPNSYIPVLDQDQIELIDIQEEHLTVIKKGPPAAPVLEMIDTLAADSDGDGLVGGSEVSALISNASGLAFLDANGDFVETNLNVQVGSGMDFPPGAFLNIYKTDDRSINVRVKITSIQNPYTPNPPPYGPYNTGFLVTILSGNKEIQGETELTVELERADALFQFKFPRFAYRYKYEDGEYSCFSPFTEPAFIPGRFNYLPKEGYNLGMVNRLRRLAIKDFVHERSIADDVISIDILYKESNSPNIYSVKTVKRVAWDGGVWDAWNGNSANTTADIGSPVDAGWKGITKGYLPITTEMIHATLPSNQLLRPWDNVPRKALAQEVIGNRLVYGNYLQNYDLKKTPFIGTGPNNIKVDIKVRANSDVVGNVAPEELHAGNKRFMNYKPTKSVKSLRTYQLGVVYIDKYGRETPVFSEDKRGATGGESTSESSIYIKKSEADKRNQLIVKMNSNPPEWATHRKYFIKETSNEYYNLAMDRCYDAEDGNIWLSFPSAERNKLDEETFLILKKAHDSGELVLEPAKYKIIAIENEAPRFIKLKNISIGAIQDDTSTAPFAIGTSTEGFPFEDGTFILIEKTPFEAAHWHTKLFNTDISQVFIRVKTTGASSLWYRIRTVTLTTGGTYYKIEVDKKFGPDMSITTPTANDFLNRNTCSVEVVKRLPEDRAEFEGRFFVKVLKDATIKTTVCPDISLDANLQPASSITVQYIDPMQSNVGTGWIQDTGKNWFGYDKFELSVDKNNEVSELGNSQGDPGHGYEYWRKASNDTSAAALAPKSSGWFIDKVEAFRPWQGSINGQTKEIGVAWNNAGTSPPTGCNLFAKRGNFDGKPLNALGLDTYGASGTYLSYLDTKSPSNGSGSLIRQAKPEFGGKVAPSVGIDVPSGIINLSHSGVSGQDSQATNYTSTTHGSYRDHASFNSLPAKHTGDELFINKLTAPGTIWRWKEDPDQIEYVTVVNNDFSFGNPYSQDEWNRENNGDLDGEKGVYLFNYAMFADYYLKPHHTFTGYLKFLGTNWIPPITDEKWDFVSRNYGNHDFKWYCIEPTIQCPLDWIAVQLAVNTWCPFQEHKESASKDHGSAWPWNTPHKRFPTGIYDWNHQVNKRRRFAFKSVVYKDMNGAKKGGPLGSGNHRYLPTNDPSLPSHFDATGTAITAYPANVASGLGGTTFASLNLDAPGIRNDGMHTGYANPGGDWDWDPDGNGLYINPTTSVQGYEAIPIRKRWDKSSAPIESAMPGSVTWQIMEPFTESDDRMASKNPAVWETEPKEDVGLDIYHEVGQIYPTELNDKTIEQFVGAISTDINKNSFVQCWHPTSGHHVLTTVVVAAGPIYTYNVQVKDIRVIAAYDKYVMLGSINSTTGEIFPLNNEDPNHTTPPLGSYLMFWRADGSETEALVGPFTHQSSPNYNINNNEGTWYELVGKPDELGVHNEEVRLPWFNCYSFGNGVESDRIRDDYNQVTIDNGPKASTTLEEPYLEERRKNGFIWSGLYNSISGVNDTNQFIQAEKITKDVNPSYGSIQKLFARDSDLIAFCEDRVLRVLANKDALYNADGNTNLVSTDRVLGNVRPFVGDYGISLNPESFASDSYRSYFSDSSRGAILRLSQDGLTPISDFGMHDWFADKLALIGDNKIIGSFDDNKGEYNITLKSQDNYSGGPTLSFSEVSKGWVSFKSWNQENGISLNNSYYTFSGGQMFQHHTNETRNNFYLTPSSPAPLEDYQYESTVDVLFNQIPSSIKSFSTLNYEGSQARITQEINDNPDYYDNFPKDGWYVKEMVSNAQELGEMEFWDKEDKWFSQVKGVKTEWLNDGTAGNIDPREFSYQGIGNASEISCLECPEVISWNCSIIGEGEMQICSCQEENGSGGEYTTEQDCLNDTSSCCGQAVESWDCYDGNCTDPGTGLGQYATRFACNSACIPGPNPCENYPGDNGCCGKCPNYMPSSNPCYNWCQQWGDCCGDDPISSWDCLGDCNTVAGGGTYGVDCGCVDPGTGLGAYSSYNACFANCGNLVGSDWECIEGNCLDVGIGNGSYNSEADCINGCSLPQVYGCTDPTALNYDPLATIDDGTCRYESVPLTCANIFTIGALEACDDFVCLLNPPTGGCSATQFNSAMGLAIYWANVITTQFNSGASIYVDLNGTPIGAITAQEMYDLLVECCSGV